MNENIEFENTNTSVITIKHIILFLYNYKIILFVGTMLCTISAIIYTRYIPKTYQSTAKLITRSSSGQSNNEMSQLAALAGISLGGNRVSVDPSKYLTEIINDRDFVLKILNHKWYIPGQKDSILLEQLWKIKTNNLNDSSDYIQETRKIDNLRKGKYIVLGSSNKLGLITLITTFGSPELTYQVNLFVLKLLDDYIRGSFKTQAQEKRIFIENRITEVSADLEKSEDDLVTFKERNLNTNAPKVFLEEQRLVRKVTLNQELYMQLKKQYELARIEEKNDKPLIEVLVKPEIPIVKSSPQRGKIVIFTTCVGFFVFLLLSLSHLWYTNVFQEHK